MTDRSWIKVAFCGGLLLGSFLFASLNASGARLRFHMHCDKTTEMGEDEVYYVVTTKKSDGTVNSFRLPGNGSHWDMNDNGKKPDVSVDLLKFDDLKKGESMVVIVAVMEEDGGSVKQWLEFGKKLGEELPTGKLTTKVTGILDIMLKIFPDIQDTDDYIGSFRVDLAYRESDGYTTAEWGAVERSSGLGQCSGPRSNCFRFDGDGTNYLGWGELFLKND